LATTIKPIVVASAWLSSAFIILGLGSRRH
jgi:hypothetical protein